MRFSLALCFLKSSSNYFCPLASHQCQCSFSQLCTFLSVCKKSSECLIFLLYESVLNIKKIIITDTYFYLQSLNGFKLLWFPLRHLYILLSRDIFLMNTFHKAYVTHCLVENNVSSVSFSVRESCSVLSLDIEKFSCLKSICFIIV